MLTEAGDSAEHKADLSPFTLPQPPPKNTGRKQGRPDEGVCQRAGGIENGFRARRKKGKRTVGGSWGGNQRKRWNSKGVDICAEIRDGGRFPT